jgi:hypothetical protein
MKIMRRNIMAYSEMGRIFPKNIAQIQGNENIKLIKPQNSWGHTIPSHPQPPQPQTPQTDWPLRDQKGSIAFPAASMILSLPPGWFATNLVMS